MASVKDTASFFAHGNSKQFDFCLKLYPQVLKLKAEKRSKKPEELIRLDDWYQNELPKRIKLRGKDAHMVHEELVQTMKWKQSRGKFYPQLSYLVKVNTPRAVMQETKKAFRKLPNLEQAITALSNLKGVGTTMASALLAAAAPDSAPFMADECLMAIPEIEGIDYTTKEYLNFVQHIQTTVTRLNSEKDCTNASWSAHRVELALWTHFVASDLKPDLLDDMPSGSYHHPSTMSMTTTVSNGIGNADGDDADVDTSEEQDDESQEKTTETEILMGLSTGATSSASSSAAQSPSASSTGVAASVAGGGGGGESTAANNATITPAATALGGVPTSAAATTTVGASSSPPSSKKLNATVTATVAEATSTTTGEETTDTTSTTEHLAKSDSENVPIEISDESNLEPEAAIAAASSNGNNGTIDSLDESTEDSLEKPITPIVVNDETNDSDSFSSAKRSIDCESSEDQTENSQPEIKKIRSG